MDKLVKEEQTRDAGLIIPPPPTPSSTSQSQIMKKSSTTTTSQNSNSTKPRRRRIRSELDRLLSDEGTRNLLKTLNKKPTKKQQQQQKNSKKIFSSSSGRGTTNRVLSKGKSRVFSGRDGGPATTTNSAGLRNGSAGNTRGKVNKPIVVKALASGGGGGGDVKGGNAGSSSSSSGRSGSPVKESNSVVDFKFVNVVKRSGVGFVTVLGGGSSNNGANHVEENGDNGVGSSGGSSSSGGNSNGSSGGRNMLKMMMMCCEGAWGVKVLNSIECAFRTLDNDASVHVIVLQSSHSRFFCNGLDLNELVLDSNNTTTSSGASNNNNNKVNNNNSSSSCISVVIKAIKCLISTLNSIRKICVASVSGDCVGFGVMVLPLFDFVYANDKSMFTLKYNLLGQSAEGIGLMQNLLRGRSGVGFSKLTNLLYLNTPLTATEALQTGLLSEILWPARYQEELASRLTAIASNSQLITKTKSSIKAYMSKFKVTDLWGEFSVIESQWGSRVFQDNLKKKFSSSSNNHESLVSRV